MSTCHTCKFSDMQSGVCHYKVPPAVRMIIDALHAEPATRIDYQALNASPDLPASLMCSAHQEVAQ
jgi:hypothetical protein